jgi:hypothetical protein
VDQTEELVSRQIFKYLFENKILYNVSQDKIDKFKLTNKIKTGSMLTKCSSKILVDDEIVYENGTLTILTT